MRKFNASKTRRIERILLSMYDIDTWKLVTTDSGDNRMIWTLL